MSPDAQTISVVIPSYNRSDALPSTMQSLARQTLGPDQFKVILVDDGSSDGSLALVEQLRPDLPYELVMLRQENRGPGAARNRGAQAAGHDLLVFLDSDIIAEPQLLATHAHLQAEQGPALLAGARRPWPDACKNQFAMAMNLDKLDVDQFTGKTPTYQEMFSSNLSIPSREFWWLGGFDESLWAYEDIDLAYRAQQAGMPLLFSREALGYHNHPMTLQQASQQQQHYQKHAAAFFAKHPELEGQLRYLVDKMPVRWRVDPPVLVLRKLARQFVAAPGVLDSLQGFAGLLERLYPHPKLLAFLYWKILASYQFRGLREGWREEGIHP